MDALLAGLPPGSHVAISHAVRTPELDAAAALYRDEADVPVTPRTREAIAELCRGLEPLASFPAGPPLPAPVPAPVPVPAPAPVPMPVASPDRLPRSPDTTAPTAPTAQGDPPDPMPLACFVGRKRR
ncbi:hypothetical protein ACQP1W_46610 [Spirillospora sp. CA-255316]